MHDGSNDFWWNKNNVPLHQKVFSTMRHLEKQHQSRLEEYYIFLNQYSSQPQRGSSLGTTPFQYGRMSGKQPTKRIRYNMIRSAIDTLSSLAASDRPRPVVLTEDGTATRMRQAGYLSKFLLGVYNANKVYENGPVVFRDAGLFGWGMYKVGVGSDGNIKIKRVYAGEIFWDLVDAYQGEPRSLHHRWWIPRAVAMKNWPSMKVEIAKCQSYTDLRRDQTTSQEDFIEIIESWHLPSMEGADDGVHTICIQHANILVEEWEFSFFPFAGYRWGDPVYGLEAEGAAAMLAGHQVAVNTHLANMEEAIGRFSVPRVWIDSASNVSFEMIDNRIGGIFRYDSAGQPPQFQTPSALEAGWVEQTRWYITSGFEMLGISQFAVGGQPPESISSGTAMREFSDQVNARWKYYQQKYEQMFIDMANMVYCFAAREYKNGNDIKSTVRGRNFIQKIKFSEVNIEKDKFELTVMPTSMLPKTPGARYATLKEYYSDGMISKEEVLELAEIPDLERVTSLASASLEDIDITIDKMLFDNIPESQLPEDLQQEAEGATPEEKEYIYADYYYVPPEPMQNLRAGQRRVAQAWAKYRWTDVPKARLDLLIRWNNDVEQMLQPQMPVVPGGPALTPQLPPGQGLGSAPDGAMNNSVSTGGPQMPPFNAPPAQQG
jgi:hypothetical protein